MITTDQGPPIPVAPSRRAAVASAALWYALPGLALVVVAAYVGIAIFWHVNPPAVPVTGQSMQPKLQAGDLVVLRGVQARELRRGDVIAFRTTKEAQSKYDVPATYVHRIVAVSEGASGREFRTKGDNVAGRDPFFVFESQVVGEVAFRIPAGGYPILFFRSRQGMIFAGMLALVLVGYFLMGLYERRQDVAALELVTLAQVAEETRELKRLVLTEAHGPRAPPAQAAATEAAQNERLCSRGCHVLPPTAKFDPHNGEALAPVVEHEPYVPVPPHLSLVPYVPAAPTIDFAKLEAEIHRAVTAGAEVQDTMRELVGAVGEYGEHLRSHTAVMQNLAASTSELHAATAEMRQLLVALTQVVTTLAERDAPPSA